MAWQAGGLKPRFQSGSRTFVASFMDGLKNVGNQNERGARFDFLVLRQLDFGQNELVGG
jgi:hypothetical protein